MRPETVVASCEAALGGNRGALAKLTSLFERQDDAALPMIAVAVAYLRAQRPRAAARVVALTGAPGVGKSTLIAALLGAPQATVKGATSQGIAVLAIDPASPRSGGALLGDRARAMAEAAGANVFFRSQSTQGVLGGIAEATASVVRLWVYFFEVIIIETVGVGQNETDVTRLASETWLILQPGGGDQLQFLKAGLMEQVDCFVLNKADLAGAAKTEAQLRAVLPLTSRAEGAAPRMIYKASSRQGDGVEGLWARLAAAGLLAASDLEAAVLVGRCYRERGRSAEALLHRHGGAAAWVTEATSAEAAWLALLARESP